MKTRTVFLLQMIVAFSASFSRTAEPGHWQRSPRTIPQALTASDWANIRQQAYLKASNPGNGDQFAHAVAVSGDTVVVGAQWEDSNAIGVNDNQTNNLATDSGAVYIFVRDGSKWVQEAYLKASNTGAGDRFGYAVAISGDVVVVGAVFESSNATGVNGNQGNNSALNSGAAYIFVRNGTNWTQEAYLKASNTGAGDLFGDSVAVSADTVLVGAATEASNATGVNGNQNNNNAPGSGAAYVFVRSGTNWSQQAYLKASNTGADDLFFKVAVSGDTVVVGAVREDSNATGVNGTQDNNLAQDSGAAYVFVRDGTNWSQQAYLKASNTGPFDQFFVVAISGDTVVVGAAFEDSSATGVNGSQSSGATDSGAVYIFTRDGTNWTQQAYLKPSNTGANDRFGWAASLSGETVVVGAHQEDSNASGVNGNQTNNLATDSGAAYVFVRNGTNWTQQAYLKASNTGATDNFGGGPNNSPGTSVAVSGDTIVIGASFERSNTAGVNGDQNNNSLSNSGAAYVFSFLPAQPPAALQSGGTVVAWGRDNSGQNLVPTGLSNIIAIAEGSDFSLALKNDGTLVSWGGHWNGKAYVPMTAPGGLTNVVAIAAGYDFGLALKSDGTVFAWGENGVGQTDVPPGLTDVVAIAAGYGHSLALTREGRVVAWGHDTSGNTAVDLDNVVAIAAGLFHSLALRSDGSVVSWGRDCDGVSIDVPADLTNVVAISGGCAHSLALKRDGTVAAWGQNIAGQINVPSGLANVVAISAGEYHSLALMDDGRVVSWGANHGGQRVPADLTNVVAIVGGWEHSLALLGTMPTTPSLNVRSSGNELILSWPINAGRFTLQSTLSVSLPASWVDFARLPAVTGTQFTITNTSSGRGEFYRLRKL